MSNMPGRMSPQLKPVFPIWKVILSANGYWICRSVDAALRRSIPAFNKDVKDMQARLEDVAFKLRIPQRKPWQGMSDNVAASLALAQQQDKVWMAVWLLHCACHYQTTSKG